MIEIRKVRNSDERSLAFVQAESWKAAFKNILSQETIKASILRWGCLLQEHLTIVPMVKIQDFLCKNIRKYRDYWDDESDLIGDENVICILSQMFNFCQEKAKKSSWMSITKLVVNGGTVLLVGFKEAEWSS